MSSGSYFPGPVRAVEIPKKGGTRVLGIPSVVDRIAQTVAVLVIEPNAEQVFHDDSYGYRPGRSPEDAVGMCRERCWKKDWVVDLDVKAFFDSVSWELMLKAVARHTDQKWVLLYVERWLKALMLMPDGTLVAAGERNQQGGPISPMIANIFLHYGFDSWMVREYPGVQFERFADDVVVHCVTERQARQVREAIGRRMVDIGLNYTPTRRGSSTARTAIGARSSSWWRSRSADTGSAPGKLRPPGRDRPSPVSCLPCPGEADRHEPQGSVLAAASTHHSTLDDLAEDVNPVLRGWLNYFTTFYPSAVIPIGKRIDRHLKRWAREVQATGT